MIRSVRPWLIILALAGARCGITADRTSDAPAALPDAVLRLSGSIQGLQGPVRIEGPVVVVDSNGLMVTSIRVARLPAGWQKGLRSSALYVKDPMGKTAPVRILLADESLGAVVLAPAPAPGDPAPRFTPVHLDDAAEAAVLDPIVMVGRLPEFLGGGAHSTPATIHSVVRRPRAAYVCLRHVEIGGEAAFDTRGRFLGVAVAPGLILAARELGGLLEQARREISRPVAGSGESR